MENEHIQECPQDELVKVIEILQGDDEQGLAQLDSLIVGYGADPKLHFLRGSVLAGLRRYEEAHIAMRRSIEIAPDYALARFQLGFLELTSGNFPAAEMTWGPLDTLPENHALRLFSTGLRHLARDEFPQAFEALREGMALNTDNAPINADIQLIISKAQETLAAQAGEARTEEPMSSTHLLLQQYAAKNTKH